MSEFLNVQSKVNHYHRVLENTLLYRKIWHDELKTMIVKQLEEVIGETSLRATVQVRSEWIQMESVQLSLGHTDSGISEVVGEARRHLIKSNGMLIYQQLFNGKIMITVVYPYIEGLGKPRPPKNLEILRPAELKAPFIIRHIEEFLKEIISWEDYDDDVPQPIGFQTGFQKETLVQ